MDEIVVKDSNGAVLQDGDTVMVVKTLKVKGSSITMKQGTIVEKIRLTDDEELSEGKVEGSVVVLRTEFLKKK